eukprot:c4176_g1_i1 orf=378-2543(+)
MRVHQCAALSLLAFAGLMVALSHVQSAEEEFSEELLLRPLPDGKVLAHFHFAHRLPPINGYGYHHRLFPKAIFQLVQKFRIQEMELSFTQGRWNYDRWGGVDPLTRLHAKPSGVELWAVFAVPDDQIDATWGNLTHALSGLFCASLNFLESPVMVAKPVRAFMPQNSNMEENLLLSSKGFVDQVLKGNKKPKSHKAVYEGRVRYGALPREAVCTENLTPWLKLLPCRDKAGLAALLDRPAIYKGWYHSLRLYIKSDEFEEHASGEHKGTLLQQTLSLVIQPSENPSSRDIGPRLQPSWSLSSLFGRQLLGQCLLAKSSAVYIEFEGPLVEKLEPISIGAEWTKRRDTCMSEGKGDVIGELECSADVNEDYESLLLANFKENSIFKVKGVPSSLSLEMAAHEKSSHGVLLAFNIPKHVNHHYVNVGLTWKAPFTWSPVRGPFRATRFLVGSGNARGAIAIVLKSNHLQTRFQKQDSSTEDGSLINVMLFQVVPWYIRLYFHTLQVLIDEQPKSFWDVVRWMHVVPSEDRRSPGVMEMELMVPSNASVISLITEFDKGFLHIDEHPPDANRGFDLPSALLSFPSECSEGQNYQLADVNGSSTAQGSALLQEFEKKKSVQLYTEVLLVPLATPDFSMPYNVVTLTCTVLALYFGSILNILRRRIGEEERLANSKGEQPESKFERLISRLLGRNRGALTSKIARVLKFILVAALLVVLNHYLSSS